MPFRRAVAWACVLILTVAALAAAQDPEIVAEVRIHGNYRTPDADILKLAGVTIGQPIDPAGVDVIAARLRKSGRFESVEIRKRLKSLEASDQVSLIIIVQEFPSTAAGGGAPSAFQRFKDSVMVLPTLNYADGYGVTYGGRVSFVRVFGKKGMLSVPLTWGATKQAALEADMTFAGGLVKRLRAGAALVSRNNPGFDIRDFRKTVSADATTPAWNALSIGVRGAWSDVSFGRTHDQLTTVGAGLILDTRPSPTFPRDAVYASIWWNRLNPTGGPAINRCRIDAQVYVGFLGASVLSARAVSSRVDGPLPVYEKPMLGGLESLRGFKAGSFVGDNIAVLSVELRIPWSSPLRLAQSGFTIFADTGAVYDHGTRLADAKAHTGVGAGFYAKVFILNFNVDVAHGIGPDTGTRAHVTAALRF